MTDGTISQSDNGGVRELCWSRLSSANAFDENLVEQLLAAVRTAASDGCRVVLLTGDGERYSAGFDLRGELDDRSLAWRFARCEELLAAVREFPGVTVAAVTGPAYGAGADLAASCDYRLGDPSARFRFPGPRFGVILGTHRLQALVGSARALDILLRGTAIDASTAANDGLLTHVLDTAQHRGFAHELAETINDLDTQTLRRMLAILRPSMPDASMAALAQSTHRSGLSERIAAYRSRTLS